MFYGSRLQTQERIIPFLWRMVRCQCPLAQLLARRTTLNTLHSWPRYIDVHCIHMTHVPSTPFIRGHGIFMFIVYICTHVTHAQRARERGTMYCPQYPQYVVTVYIIDSLRHILQFIFWKCSPFSLSPFLPLLRSLPSFLPHPSFPPLYPRSTPPPPPLCPSHTQSECFMAAGCRHRKE